LLIKVIVNDGYGGNKYIFLFLFIIFLSLIIQIREFT
ncbi:hypothetical protein LCGC14_0924240, partial [marine sediment metagenome]